MDEPRDHGCDGKEEDDRPKPRWWLNLSLLMILFSLGYGIYDPTVWFSSGSAGWSSEGRYEAEVDHARQRRPKLEVAGSAEEIRRMLADPVAVDAGHQVYSKRCSMCHGEEGEGKIGPSFLDAEWKYGSEPLVVFESVAKGRPGGMPPWRKVLSEEELYRVTAYVMSLGKPGSGASQGGSAGAPRSWMPRAVQGP